MVAMIVNAIEASPLHATIELIAERIPRSNDAIADGIAEVGDSDRPRCRISVRDQGCGLPADRPERVFEFSYSTKQQGMGLGLALARQALQRQGGTTCAENNTTGGATVSVVLPLSQKSDRGD